MKSSVFKDFHIVIFKCVWGPVNASTHAGLSESRSGIKDKLTLVHQLIFLSSFIFLIFMLCLVLPWVNVPWSCWQKHHFVLFLQLQSENVFKNLKCAVFIEFIMTRRGIHAHNVPIVAYSLHIEVGVGFPCLHCAFLTSWCSNAWQPTSSVSGTTPYKKAKCF